MNYVKQLCEGNPDEWVHNLFTRYGRGDFNGPVASIKNGKTLKIKTSYEYCTILGNIVVSNSTGLYKVDGGIFSKSDFREKLNETGVEYDDKSKKKYFVAKFQAAEITAEDLTKVYEACSDAQVMLTLKPLEKQKARINCGKKPPKPGKEEVKVDFIKSNMPQALLDKVIEEIFFGIEGEFTEASVKHIYHIKELVVPEGLDSLQARLMAKRTGDLERTIIIDDKESSTTLKLDI